jgi:hypothetical protein
MEKTVIRFLIILLCVTAIASCSRNDDLHLTGVDGKPSRIGYNNAEDHKGNAFFIIRAAGFPK